MLNNVEHKKLRCAIYARKSSEKGLDLEYNSLEFQYNRCLEYIEKQPDLEFVKYYEDAGISGKEIKNRPSFISMMEDVKNKNIDCIVVYKLDRLSRSIVDLANLVEDLANLDAHFISVTQQIDTSNSCGKLSFNMLAAIAQFEREIASERVKDKVASAKTQGFWTGGIIPLGYDNINKKLEINEKEASIVQYIFKQCLNNQGIYCVMQELQAQNMKNKQNKPFTINNITYILKNPIYIGKVKYRGMLYDGQHKAIIDYDTWEKIQELLGKKTFKKYIKKNKSDNLLTGLLFCAECNCSMTPVSTKKDNLRYRYYACSSFAKHITKNSCQIKRISAIQIENIVMGKIFEIIKSSNFIDEIVNQTNNYGEADIFEMCKSIEKTWEYLFTIEKQKIVRTIIKRVSLFKDNIEIDIYKEGLETIISKLTGYEINHNDSNEIYYTINIPFSIIKSPSYTKLIQLTENKNNPPVINKFYSNLIKYIALAWKWKKYLENKKYSNLIEIANAEHLNKSYVYKIYHLNYLAPDIIEAIINGQCTKNITIRQLSRMHIPLLWEEQRKIFFN